MKLLCLSTPAPKDKASELLQPLPTVLIHKSSAGREMGNGTFGCERLRCVGAVTSSIMKNKLPQCFSLFKYLLDFGHVMAFCRFQLEFNTNIFLTFEILQPQTSSVPDTG